MYFLTAFFKFICLLIYEYFKNFPRAVSFTCLVKCWTNQPITEKQGASFVYWSKRPPVGLRWGHGMRFCLCQ